MGKLTHKSSKCPVLEAGLEQASNPQLQQRGSFRSGSRNEEEVCRSVLVWKMTAVGVAQSPGGRGRIAE